MNYGIRIAIEGEDVKTCDDLDTIVNSKYPLLKGTLSGSGQKTVTSGTTGTVTIAHGLSYIPFAKGLFTPFLSQYFNAPYIENNPNNETNFQVRSDATNVYLDFSWLDIAGGNPETFDYVYYIFKDVGDL